jgi:hypothetical protein
MRSPEFGGYRSAWYVRRDSRHRSKSMLVFVNSLSRFLVVVLLPARSCEYCIAVFKLLALVRSSNSERECESFQAFDCVTMPTAPKFFPLSSYWAPRVLPRKCSLRRDQREAAIGWHTDLIHRNDISRKFSMSRILHLFENENEF